MTVCLFVFVSSENLKRQKSVNLSDVGCKIEAKRLIPLTVGPHFFLLKVNHE